MQHAHKELRVWQEAMLLAEAVYHETATFPREETYGMVSQMRRAAVSIPSNIAEGAGRQHTRELIQFLRIASGSLAELDTQVELAVRLGLLDKATTLRAKNERVSALVMALAKSLKRKMVETGE